MLERTRDNPNAIIYGTFYSYPVMYNYPETIERSRARDIPYNRTTS
jgi:hypothetical protein